MSKLGHRKSLSTSALSVIASSSPAEGAPTPAKAQRERRGRSHLPPGGNEAQPESASLTVLHGLTGMVDDRRRERTGDSAKEVKRERGEGSVEELLHDLRSLRSSSKRRLAALDQLGKSFVHACRGGDTDALEDFLLLSPHTTLLSLLTRHAAALSLRSSHTSLPAGDELATGLIPELHAIVSMLQGLCLLSQTCKEAVGDDCVLEMFIDTLLLLRAQPPIKQDKPICYGIMELLFCILVDSSKNARTFEKLSGLEAVVRVLKGSGVTKDVRMKCIEFLYFYLLPESEANQRLIASSNADLSNGALYPPSPPSLGDTRNEPRSKPARSTELDDVNVPFVPTTPRKKPQPNLGFLTPAHRHVSGASFSSSSTPALPPIFGSPIATPQVKISQSSTGLSRMVDEDSPTERSTPRSESMNRGSSDESGRLGLGMPRVGMSRSSTRPNLSGASTDPFNLASSSERSHSGSSGSSTVVPSHGIPRSQTQMLSNRPASRLGRSESLRRVSPSPAPREGAAQKTRNGSSGSSLVPQTHRMRHSRTQSHLSGLPPPTASVPDVPAVPSAHKPRPSKPRAFPAELTRGLPPSMSTPSLAGMAASPKVVLGPAKRVSSISQKPVERGNKEGETKSVAEKKEMLGKWLGNVEQLVQGVEKGSFWGSVGKERR
ncbi:hypothetical protein IAR50_004127 [Cryptococcus sp. DSM 104548]